MKLGPVLSLSCKCALGVTKAKSRLSGACYDF